MCEGRGLDSQVPSTNKKITHLYLYLYLYNHHSIEDLLQSCATRQGARRGGASDKEPGLGVLQPRV